MNRTLVELARAMLIASDLPEFLWEHAVVHAVYLRNRTYTKAVEGTTPYERWNNKKPNVAHLREFGAPVWILAQGQNVARKMLPKSHRKAYVGYEDQSNSVIYYNAETRKILTSRNHQFINSPIASPSPIDEIEITPDNAREGELTDGDSMRTNQCRSAKRKADQIEETVSDNEPRRTRGLHRL